MRLIDEIRLNLKEDYEIVNQFWVSTYENDCDCLIVINKKNGTQYKVSVEELDKDD